jgi:hypothetical protein
MKLTLGKKLGMGFAVTLALMVFSSVMAYLKSGDIKESQDLMFRGAHSTDKSCRRIAAGSKSDIERGPKNYPRGNRTSQEREREAGVRCRLGCCRKGHRQDG